MSDDIDSIGSHIGNGGQFDPECDDAIDWDFETGDYVEKFTGEALWSGWIVSGYQKRNGKPRYVVEIDPQGFQMIAVPSQLRKVKAC